MKIYDDRFKAVALVRDKYFDLIKGIAIILVVFGHCIQYGSGDTFYNTESYFDNLVFKAIYSFHMPLFAIVSGYLFFFSVSKRSATVCIKKQFMGLCIPIIAWALTIAVLKKTIQLVLLKQGVDLSWFLSVIRSCLTDLWFLWSMFWCSLLIILNRKLSKDNPIAYLLIGVLLLFCPDKLNSNKYIFLYPYFIAGYLFHKYAVGQKLSERVKTVIGIVAACVWCIMLAFYEKEHYIYTTGTFLLGKDMLLQFGIDVFRWVIGTAGSVTILYIVFLFKNIKNPFFDYITMLGTKTMGVYIVSNYANTYLLMRLTRTFNLNYFIILLETVIMLVLTLMISWVLSRNRIINKIYLGGR